MLTGWLVEVLLKSNKVKHRTVVPVFRSQRYKDFHKFKAHLVNKAISRPARAI